MPYDKGQDECLFETEVEADDASYRVGIFRYGGGQPRIGVNKIIQREDKPPVFRNMGRLTPDQAGVVMDGISECLVNWPAVPKPKKKAKAKAPRSKTKGKKR